mgnify:CR=1 FL=1
MVIIQKIAQLLTGMNWLIIPAALFTIVLHEISHGYVAFLLGDRTAKDAGRLTLNPIRHMDVIGLLCMVIFGFGWAKPVPVNPYYFKNRKGGMALVALAGPASNLILAVFGLLLYRLVILIAGLSGVAALVASSDVVYYLILGFARFFSIFAMLNVGLAIFNLIPIPPLDGSKIVNAILPDRIYYQVMKYEQFGFLILLVILNIPLLEGWITAAQSWVFGALCTLVGI